MSKNPRSSSGVTLLELLVALAVIGILLAVALPSYRHFIDRAGRNEAKALLLEIATNQERYFLTARRFGSLTELGYADPLVSESGAYTISIPNNTSVSFVATATYNRAGNEQARCGSFSINQLGEKTSRGSATNCWRR